MTAMQWIAVLMLSTSPTGVAARPGDEVPVNPKAITFEHDGANAAGFALYVSRDATAAVRIDLGPVSPSSHHRITVDLRELPDGAYEMAVAAYNSFGESSKVPTSPAHFVIKRGRTDVAGIPTPVVTTDAKKDRKQEQNKEKNGIWGRFWRVVVGDDADNP